MTSKKKPAAKPARKAVPPAKAAKKPAAKPAGKPVAKVKPPSRPAAKPVAKKPAPKPIAKGKPAARPVAKAPVKPVAKKPAPAPVKKAPVKAALPVKPASKPAPKPVVKAPVKPAAKPVAQVKPAPAPVKPAPIAHKPLVPKKPEVPKYVAPKGVNKLAEIRKALKAKKQDKPAKAVAMPKINATTSRKYEPEFTRSVLDQPVSDQTGPTMRYSDAELIEFKELITRKLDAAKKELAYLHGLITRKDEMSGDETDNRYMTMEDGSLSMEREQLSQMASRQHDFIDKLEKALMRIENKTYGICRVTGKLIDKARLRAVPHATLSIEAKMGMARNPNMQ
jgi:RNA polymerase-binding transcription factor DksA